MAELVVEALKGFNKLRERYTEDTADVFFVEKETKERLPAHREVLKVASAVYFKMFDGDWKEKGEKEIPAPEQYEWDSFKTAIALLYGEEVEIKESSIVDIYRVAHCYDLKDVVYSLVQDIRQWDSSMMGAMMKLCALVGELETDEDQMHKDVLQTVVQYLAQNFKDICGESLAEVSYQAMLMLVQSEDIQISEVDLLSRLIRWIKDHSDLTLVQAEKLLSHIRFGTIPYETLTACEVGHKNLNLALQSYQQPFEMVRKNMVQVTPRLCQKEVFQVFPMAGGLFMARQGHKWESTYTNSSPAVGVVYFGRQEVSFKGSIQMASGIGYTFVCRLSSISTAHKSTKAESPLQESVRTSGVSITFCYQHFSVVLNQTGAHIVLQSTDSPLSTGQRSISKTLELPFTGPFPWLLTFGLTGNWGQTTLHSFTFTCPVGLA